MTGYSIGIDWLSATSYLITQHDIERITLAKMRESNGRAPYQYSYRTANNGVTVYMSDTGKLPTLVEVSGVGCNEHGNLIPYLVEHAKVTRIDIAMDFTCEIDYITADSIPSGYFNTASGVTYYYGSPKSDNMIRVYRYNPPHPRSDRTRIEQVFRKDQAQLIANQWIMGNVPDIESTVAKKLLRYKCNVPFDIYGEPIRLKNDMIGSRPMAGTIRWLQTSVNPAIKRLIDSGISIEEIKQWIFT